MFGASQTHLNDRLRPDHGYAISHVRSDPLAAGVAAESGEHKLVCVQPETGGADAVSVTCELYLGVKVTTDSTRNAAGFVAEMQRAFVKVRNHCEPLRLDSAIVIPSHQHQFDIRLPGCQCGFKSAATMDEIPEHQQSLCAGFHYAPRQAREVGKRRIGKGDASARQQIAFAEMDVGGDQGALPPPMQGAIGTQLKVLAAPGPDERLVVEHLPKHRVQGVRPCGARDPPRLHWWFVRG